MVESNIKAKCLDDENRPNADTHRLLSTGRSLFLASAILTGDFDFVVNKSEASS
jgi:hypothetical protein